MTARLIDGKMAAAKLRAEVAAEVAKFRASTDRVPGLAVVLVGEDPASAVYVRSKGKATLEAGMQSFEHKLPEETSEAELLALVGELNGAPAVDGILVQLPLPKQIDADKVLTSIDADKDVDGFHPINAGRLAIGLPGFVACTPLGCLKLLRAELGD
ncbi:MAG TPA: tetrahydrofolate dehydrogenase/cyclohydrolase catalytic domain-containing protein, partial [Sphingomicrobium sp.]|nr:tetrahydrofolate dehydrogenase/cyclohydrolase catalytic domain-containing protein [Sphingomicrobium sp.]